MPTLKAIGGFLSSGSSWNLAIINDIDCHSADPPSFPTVHYSNPLLRSFISGEAASQMMVPPAANETAAG